MAEEYPKALYNPDGGAMVTVVNREQEVEQLEEWGQEIVPMLPLSSAGQTEADLLSKIDALKAELESVNADKEAKERRDADALAQVEAKKKAAAEKAADQK